MKHESINDAENYDIENFKNYPMTHMYVHKMGRKAHNIKLLSPIIQQSNINENSKYRKTWKLMMPIKESWSVA